MESPSPSTLVGALESPEKKGTYMDNSILNPIPPSTNWQNRTDFDGPVAILWDIENCPVPSDVRPEDVAGNIRMALQVHPVINGSVMSFSAFGDFNAFPRRLREGCQRTGVKLVDVPNGRKDAADKAILVDMFLFALDNPPPSTIMLISGDVDFAPAVHILGQRGYTIILVIPSGVGVSSALCNASKFVWDWPSVARGEGFLPPGKVNEGFGSSSTSYVQPRDPNCLKGQLVKLLELFGGCLPLSRIPTEYHKIFGQQLCLSEYGASKLVNLLRKMNGAIAVNGEGQNQFVYSSLTSYVQPGDPNGLKGQLVKLLALSGGRLPLSRISTEYQKIFGRELCLSEYGASKLVNLLRKMNDAIAIDGEGQNKFVYLRSWKAGPTQTEPPSAPPRKDKKGRGPLEDSGDLMTGCCISLDECLYEDQLQTVERGDKSDDQSLQEFKYELQDILVSYSCRIFLCSFETVYKQRYKRPLDYQRLGVKGLEELFKKMRDIVNVQTDPISKRKFISAIFG